MSCDPPPATPAEHVAGPSWPEAALLAELAKLRRQRRTCILAGSVNLLLRLVLFAFPPDSRVAPRLGHPPRSRAKSWLEGAAATRTGNGA
ncbi:MAG: hypothetical protein M0T72_06060 [Candidatus Dormibacteraeota bacterium]|nr:hypothetical protein [Candidatus Dormibacteraeota bacterium]